MTYALKTFFIRAVSTTHDYDDDDDDDDDCCGDDNDDIIIPDLVITSFTGSKFLMQWMGLETIPVSQCLV
jgi:hypothetical protein